MRRFGFDPILFAIGMILLALALIIASWPRATPAPTSPPAPPALESPPERRITPVVWGARADVISGTEGHLYHLITCPVLPEDRAPVRWEWAREEGWVPCAVCEPDEGR